MQACRSPVSGARPRAEHTLIIWRAPIGSKLEQFARLTLLSQSDFTTGYKHMFRDILIVASSAVYHGCVTATKCD